MTGWLLDTLLWTGVLIALVLLVRRPVAHRFGPHTAYALWALPALRLVLPPITLPAWMRPASSGEAAMTADAIPALDNAAPLMWQASLPVADAPAAPQLAGFDPLAWIESAPVLEILFALWLGGAVLFLWQRFGAYFSLREELLEHGRVVGLARERSRTIRLVETKGTRAPLAFGVIDPVIAMPPGFMAQPDRTARDLALAHELAHHRGHDLLINVLVQPLFALHWWNPLGRYGWLALRRDQEAACDARVIAARSAAERAAYARLIASFATGPNLALAAPMACPVLGDKSIIHRLRSLKMSETSSHRRLSGRILMGAAVLALPLTASISYAGSAAQTAPEPPTPPSAPQVPEPPVPPTSPVEAPQPPEPPQAPEAPDVREELIASLALGSEKEGEGKAASKVIVIERTERDENGKQHRSRTVQRFGSGGDGLKTLHFDKRALNRMSKAEHEELTAEMREALAEADRELADLPRALALAMKEAEAARANTPRVLVMNDCRLGGDEVSETFTGKDGKQIIMICPSRISAQVRQGMEEARAEIARDKDIPEDTRKRLLKQLDGQIARWAEKEG